MPHSGIWLFCRTHPSWWQPRSSFGRMDTFLTALTHMSALRCCECARSGTGESRKKSGGGGVKPDGKMRADFQLCRKLSHSGGHQVHKVVWGCKHPRLEAAFQTELSVWCLLPPTASCSTATQGQGSVRARPHVPASPFSQMQVRQHNCRSSGQCARSAGDGTLCSPPVVQPRFM